MEVAELDGPPMFARIGIMRALNRDYVREFNSSRKDTHWGRHRLQRDTSWRTRKRTLANQPTTNLPSKQSREAERQRVVKEYVMDLREILEKLRKLFN
jgi:hypothetical protein